MNYQKKYYKNLDLESIIAQRLRLQSVQRFFTDNLFIQGLDNVSYLKSFKFIDFYVHMNEVTRKSFLINLGGPANYNKTRQYMDSLINELSYQKT